MKTSSAQCQCQQPTYSLYAERDGIAYGWDGFADNLVDADSTRALLDRARRELAYMNSRFGTSGICYVHLLQHHTPNCNCLDDAEPGEHCRVVETFAPAPGATKTQDVAAALTWLAGHAQKRGIDWTDLSEAVHDVAATEAAQTNNDGTPAQLGYLLEKCGQQQTMELIAEMASSTQES
ncbi:hypothetical protein [Streptomyces sp. NPDC001948]